MFLFWAYKIQAQRRDLDTRADNELPFVTGDGGEWCPSIWLTRDPYEP